jgi:hypothetical protein
MKDVLISFVVWCLLLGAVIDTIFLPEKHPLFSASSLALVAGIRICIIVRDAIRSK